MLKPEIFITLKPCNPGEIESLDVKLTFDKEESGGLATFQALGRLHREMDAVYDLDPKYAPMALNYFHALFCEELDWPAHVPLHILFMAPSWDYRMRMAWELLSEEERATALELDYKLVHNYWPSLNFLDVSWRAEVENNPIICSGARH